LTSPNGRFRVRRGDLEIEYEGVNFVQEYGAALRYLGFAEAQTRLEETEPQPAENNRSGSAIRASSSPSASPSSPPPILISKAGSGESTREDDLESRGLDSIGPLERQVDDTTAAGASPDETPFDAFLRRIARGPKGGGESAEPKPESGEAISEGATPTTPGDDKYKQVLKRLGIPS
jgi:hypothetical protein